MSNTRQTKKTPRRKTSGPRMKRNIKDSVFTHLFGEEKYQIELFKALHPQKKITSKDLKVETLKPVLTDGLYNDLCMLIKDRSLIFVEAQSTYCPNLAMRMFFYVSDTYKKWCKKHKVDLYQGKSFFPSFEIYVIYTGNRKNVPDELNFNQLIPPANIKVRILKSSPNSKKDIIAQYIRFCKIADEEAKRHRNERDVAIKAVLERCKKEGILVEFLERKCEEIISVMEELLSQKTAVENYAYRRETEGEARGLAKGEARGMDKKAIAIAKKMLQAGSFSLKQIAEMTDLSMAKLSSLKAQM